MPERSTLRELLQHAGFQSALVRMAIWLFALLYSGAGSVAGHFVVDQVLYGWLFGVYLVLFAGLLVSVVVRPVWPARRHLSLLLDVSATGLAIYLSGNATSPFFLLLRRGVEAVLGPDGAGRYHA